MEPLPLFGLAICGALLGALFRSRQRELALLLSLAACAVVLVAALSQWDPLLLQLRVFLEDSATAQSAFTVLLKAAGLAVLGRLAAALCRDSGDSALAWAVDLAAKAAILAAAMPLLLEVLAAITQITGEVLV